MNLLKIAVAIGAGALAATGGGAHYPTAGGSAVNGAGVSHKDIDLDSHLLYDSGDQADLGAACTDGHSQGSNDVCVGGSLQVDGMLWCDAGSTVAGAALDVQGQMITEGDGTYSWDHSPSGFATEGSVEVDGALYADGDVYVGGMFHWTSSTEMTAPADGQLTVTKDDGVTGATLDFTTADTLTVKDKAGTGGGTIAVARFEAGSNFLNSSGGLDLTDDKYIDLANGGYLEGDATLDQMAMHVGANVGRQIVIGEYAHRGSDYGHATPTNPTIFMHSATDPDSANDEWVSVAHDVTNAVVGTGSGIIDLEPATKGVGLPIFAATDVSTPPVTCNATNFGVTVAVDDTDDNAASEVCYCGASTDDGGGTPTYDWLQFGDAGACSFF